MFLWKSLRPELVARLLVHIANRKAATPAGPSPAAPVKPVQPGFPSK